MGASGFSIIELVGAMLIMAILLGIVSEAVVKRVHLAQREMERSELRQLEQGLVNAIRRTRSLPGAGAWSAFLADEMAVSAGQAGMSRAGQSRWLLVDPQMRLGTAGATQGAPGLPYTQTAQGSIEPQGARLVLVSSTADALPADVLATIQAAGPGSSAAFNMIWNTGERQLPTGWTGWGDPDDLHILRIDAKRLFHRVILNNLEFHLTAQYALDVTNNTGTVTAGLSKELWVVDGTDLHLYEAGGTLQAREFVDAPMSYVYENGRWGRGVVQGKTVVDGEFGQLVDDFLATPAPPLNQTQFGANQQAIVDMFYLYLYTYGQWATGDPPFNHGGSSSHQQVPDYRILDATQTHMDAFTYNITR